MESRTVTRVSRYNEGRKYRYINYNTHFVSSEQTG
jgi:hypothetical protein